MSASKLTSTPRPTADVPARPTLLDSALVRRQRQSLGLSEREVAKRLGVTGQVIASLERGANHHEVSASLVHALAGLLALDPQDVFTTKPTPPADVTAADDARTVGALLAGEGNLVATDVLGSVLGWDTDRTRAALAVLEAALPAAGLRLHRLGSDIKIVPGDSQLPAGAAATLNRRSFARRGMNLAQARMLRQVHLGTLAGQEHGNAARVTLATLINAGLVDAGAGNSRGTLPTLSDDVAFSLGPALPPAHAERRTAGNGHGVGKAARKGPAGRAPRPKASVTAAS